MAAKRKIWPKDSLGRRTDGVKPREIKKMERLYQEGRSPGEIASMTNRDTRTVKKYLGLVADNGSVAIGSTSRIQKHIDRLFHFGTRFRERLLLPYLFDAAAHEEVLGKPAVELGMWKGEPSGYASSRAGYPTVTTLPMDPEELSVADEWMASRLDARTCSLYPAFQGHLASQRVCWHTLSRTEAAFNDYVEACRRAYQVVLDQLHTRVPDVLEYDAGFLALSLVKRGTFRRSSGTDHIVKKSVKWISKPDWAGWVLEIGPSQIGHSLERDLPDRLYEADAELYSRSPYQPNLDRVVETEAVFNDAISTFRATLHPDDRLRKLILNGQCDLCP